MSRVSRRSFMKASVIGTFTAILANISRSVLAAVFAPTPPETEGPFHPIFPQKDKDFDLTRIVGSNESAKGKVIVIEGQVLDTDGHVVEDAMVDLWQANAAGRYRHPRDQNRAPLDPNFQGWAFIQSGKQGGFRFKTIFPGAYPASSDWIRPPHIHFKVSKNGYVTLTTQMYFPGQKLNETDLLLMNKSDEEQRQMIATLIQKDPETYQFNIILKAR